MSHGAAAGTSGSAILSAPGSSTQLDTLSAATPTTTTVSEVITLKLVPKRKKKSVKWTEDTVEVNEFMDKKKSKKCCIFHKKKKFGEWSDDEDSDSECDECGPRVTQQQKAPAVTSQQETVPQPTPL